MVVIDVRVKLSVKIPKIAILAVATTAVREWALWRNLGGGSLVEEAWWRNAVIIWKIGFAFPLNPPLDGGHRRRFGAIYKEVKIAIPQR